MLRGVAESDLVEGDANMWAKSQNSRTIMPSCGPCHGIPIHLTFEGGENLELPGLGGKHNTSALWRVCVQVRRLGGWKGSERSLNRLTGYMPLVDSPSGASKMVLDTGGAEGMNNIAPPVYTRNQAQITRQAIFSWFTIIASRILS